MSERSYTGWFVFAVVFMFFAGVFAVLALLAEGDTDAAADASIDFANGAMLVGVTFVLLPAVVEALYQLRRRTGRLAWLLDEDEEKQLIGEYTAETHLDNAAKEDLTIRVFEDDDAKERDSE